MSSVLFPCSLGNNVENQQADGRTGVARGPSLMCQKRSLWVPFSGTFWNNQGESQIHAISDPVERLSQGLPAVLPMDKWPRGQ